MQKIFFFFENLLLQGVVSHSEILKVNFVVVVDVI